MNDVFLVEIKLNFIALYYTVTFKLKDPTSLAMSAVAISTMLPSNVDAKTSTEPNAAAAAKDPFDLTDQFTAALSGVEFDPVYIRVPCGKNGTGPEFIYSVEKLNIPYLATIRIGSEPLKRVCQQVQCNRCRGPHSVLVCPLEVCFACGEAGHWNLVCRNGATGILSAAEYSKKCAEAEEERAKVVSFAQ